MSEDYFLSKSNPIATVDQRTAEDTALSLIARPEVQQARKQVEGYMRAVLTNDIGDLVEGIDPFLDEYMFHYALRAVNWDANFPKVVQFLGPPHHWFGRDVPGSRYGSDCVDFIYRTIAIGHGNSYVITGKATCDIKPMTNYILKGGSSFPPNAMGALESLDMEFDGDGNFNITIDSTPADGRKNHLQTRPGATQLWIRDALVDWSNQSPNALRVEMLSAPTRSPLTEDEMAALLVRQAVEGVYFNYYNLRLSFLVPRRNELKSPEPSALLGGFPSQFAVGTAVSLAEDEALIVTASHSGATFRNAILTDPFTVSLNYWDYQTTLNSAQMEPDADGRFTYVLSHQDPGTHNWLDCRGEPLVYFIQRWQAFDRSREPEVPTISSRLVRLSDLEPNLPDGIKRVDGAGREQQLTRRQEGFARRFSDT